MVDVDVLLPSNTHTHTTFLPIRSTLTLAGKFLSRKIFLRCINSLCLKVGAKSTNANGVRGRWGNRFGPKSSVDWIYESAAFHFRNAQRHYLLRPCIHHNNSTNKHRGWRSFTDSSRRALNPGTGDARQTCNNTPGMCCGDWRWGLFRTELRSSTRACFGRGPAMSAHPLDLLVFSFNRHQRRRLPRGHITKSVFKLSLSFSPSLS